MTRLLKTVTHAQTLLKLQKFPLTGKVLKLQIFPPAGNSGRIGKKRRRYRGDTAAALSAPGLCRFMQGNEKPESVAYGKQIRIHQFISSLIALVSIYFAIQRLQKSLGDFNGNTLV